jgi:ribosome biogenesis GTPase
MKISELRTIGRVIGLHGQRAELYTDNGVVDAVIRGKVKYGETDESPIAVGDYVEFSCKNPNMATIEKIRPRKSVISRPAVEKKDYTQVLVSNVDRFIIVTSVAQPPFKSGLVDRFLVIAFKEKIHPVIVMNKIDLGNPKSFIRYLDAWQKISCDIIYTCAKSGQGIDSLIPILKNGTSAIVGHSGVGKSSLINRINPELDIKTKAISTYSGKGTHTTSSSIIYRLFPDGWVADTPGLKDLGLAGISKSYLYRYFPEFEQFESECQFSNCIHVNEPGCGVKNALSRNDSGIAEFRYDSYLKMLTSLND